MPHDETPDLDKLKADIASRLRTACAHLPEDEFADLVHQIAWVKLKYSRLGGPESGSAGG